MNLAEAAGAAKVANENFVEHFGGRFGPTLELIGAHLFVLGAVNDAIFAVEMGSVKRADEESDGKLWLVRGGRRAFENGELVIVAGASGAAAGKKGADEKSDDEHCCLIFHGKFLAFESHGWPGLCSLGVVARSSVYGLVLMVSVNSLRFSLTWRMFSRISSMFSELAPRVLLSWPVRS